MPGCRRDIDRKLRNIFMAAVPFVMARHKTTGGFGATPRLPATIEDTYHALNILGLVRQFGTTEGSAIDPFTENSLSSYLDVSRRHLPAGAGTTFRLLRCCRTAGLEFDPEAVEAAIIERMRSSACLEDWYYCARIQVEVLGRKPLKVAEANLVAVLERTWRSVDQAWMHMYLWRIFRAVLPRPASELIAWFRACQNGDGGFGFFPKTTSFAENCHVCLQALAFLGAAPRDPDRAFGFLNGCQTVSGGFGRSSRAAPFLDATWHALAGMAFINCDEFAKSRSKLTSFSLC